MDVGEFVEELDHPGLVPDDKGIDYVHVRLLGAKLHQIRQVLKAFGHQSQRPVSSFRWRLSDKIKGFRVSGKGGTRIFFDNDNHDEDNIFH